MFNYVYCLFNKLSKRFESVMSFPSDSMALHRLDKNIDKEEYDIARVGKVSIESGTIEPCPPVFLVWENVEALPKTEAK